MGSRRKRKEAVERVAWNQEDWLPMERRIEPGRSNAWGLWKWALTLAAMGGGSALWAREGVLAAVAFSALVGAFAGAVAPRRPSARKEPSPLPPMLYVWMFGGCFWITAASAFLVAALLRTVGAPYLEAAGVCFVVEAGAAFLAGVTTSLYEERRALRGR